MKAKDQTVLTLHKHVIISNSRISVLHDEHRTWRLKIKVIKNYLWEIEYVGKRVFRFKAIREEDRGCYMCQINTRSMKKQLGCIQVLGEEIPFKTQPLYSGNQWKRELFLFWSLALEQKREVSREEKNILPLFLTQESVCWYFCIVKFWVKFRDFRHFPKFPQKVEFLTISFLFSFFLQSPLTSTLSPPATISP